MNLYFIALLVSRFLGLWLAGCSLVWQSAKAEESLFPLSQSYLVDTWRLDDLLPGCTTTDIAQTPDGYLWVGSFDGVLRFDGKHFVLFKPEGKKELPSPWVLRLFVEHSGTLWLGTAVGPVRISQGVWEDLHAKPGWPDASVSGFAQNSRGEMYIATPKSVLKWNADHFEEIHIPPVKTRYC